MQLRKELARAQRTSSVRQGGASLPSKQQREHDFFTMSLAEKDYHITSQLGE